MSAFLWRRGWAAGLVRLMCRVRLGAPLLLVFAALPAVAGPAILLDINGPIGPATSEYVVDGLETAREEKAGLVVLRIDTPGGLDTSMRTIIKAIIASPVPVAAFVPSGGRAASAGTYILYASHIAAMAPGTNLGAATPVQIGGGSRPLPLPEFGKKPAPNGDAPNTAKRSPGLEEKVKNDAIAYIRSLAKLRGRNEEWAAKAVREAASLPAEEALALGVIDLIASNAEDLVARVDGRSVVTSMGPHVIDTAGARLVPVSPDWRARLLSVITNPTVAYILLMIGIYGLLFEFYSPGLIAPGVIGGICLLLGMYALQLLPVNYAGVALTMLGIALIIAETFVPSFGALGIGGIAAFVFGSVILFETDAPGYGVSWPLIAAMSGVGAGVTLLSLVFFARSWRRAVVSGPEEMIGSTGSVVDWSGEVGHVRVHGELWRAQAGHPLSAGGKIRVRDLDGLTLIVEPETSER